MIEALLIHCWAYPRRSPGIDHSGVGRPTTEMVPLRICQDAVHIGMPAPTGASDEVEIQRQRIWQRTL